VVFTQVVDLKQNVHLLALVDFTKFGLVVHGIVRRDELIERNIWPILPSFGMLNSSITIGYFLLRFIGVGKSSLILVVFKGL
jgi:hypothetical protein